MVLSILTVMPGKLKSLTRPSKNITVEVGVLVDVAW